MIHRVFEIPRCTRALDEDVVRDPRTVALVNEPVSREAPRPAVNRAVVVCALVKFGALSFWET